jgi:hypothetical protein
MGVGVGDGVAGAVGVNNTAGVVVAVGAEEKDAQDEKIKVDRKRTTMSGVNLFRMDCILLNYKKKCEYYFAKNS